jgi:methane/ammonia monooxygenase subunit A
VRPTAEAAIAARIRQQDLRDLLTRKLEFIDRKWDFVFFLTAAFAVAAAGDITRLLFAGDWDFWVDWKDRQWWPIVTPFATIIIPSAIQYIVWLVFRMPMGATYTALCMFLAAWIGRVFQWQDLVAFPLTVTWPATVIPAAILLDWILYKTRSFVLTSLLGGLVWAFVFWVSNLVSLAPYLQPVEFMGQIHTVADVLGIQYVRTQTPEYLRLIESGTLRSFLEETQYVSMVFGATLTVIGYWIGQAIARWLAIAPIGRGIKGF